MKQRLRLRAAVAMLALFAVALVSWPLFAAQQDQAGIDVGQLLNQLIAAWSGRAYVLVVALIAGTCVALAKQGYLGNWIQTKLPPPARPWVALGLTEVAMMATEIQAGKTWQQALGDGVLAAALAVFGHQVGVEGMRGGKEMLPPAKGADGSGPGGGGSVNMGPQLPKPMTPQPKESVPPTARRIAENRRGMRMFFPVALVGAMATCVTGCASFQKWWQTVQADPSAAVAQLIRTVQNVIATADTVWSFVAPLLGDKATEATKIYADAKVTVVDALTALENGVNADVEVQKDNPNWGALENDVKAAVANLIAIVQQYAGGSTALGGSLSGNAPVRHGLATLAANGAAVASWRNK